MYHNILVLGAEVNGLIILSLDHLIWKSKLPFQLPRLSESYIGNAKWNLRSQWGRQTGISIGCDIYALNIYFFKSFAESKSLVPDEQIYANLLNWHSLDVKACSVSLSDQQFSSSVLHHIGMLQMVWRWTLWGMWAPGWGCCMPWPKTDGQLPKNLVNFSTLLECHEIGEVKKLLT